MFVCVTTVTVTCDEAVNRDILSVILHEEKHEQIQ